MRWTGIPKIDLAALQETPLIGTNTQRIQNYGYRLLYNDL